MTGDAKLTRSSAVAVIADRAAWLKITLLRNFCFNAIHWDHSVSTCE